MPTLISNAEPWAVPGRGLVLLLMFEEYAFLSKGDKVLYNDTEYEIIDELDGYQDLIMAIELREVKHVKH